MLPHCLRATSCERRGVFCLSHCWRKGRCTAMSCFRAHPTHDAGCKSPISRNKSLRSNAVPPAATFTDRKLFFRPCLFRPVFPQPGLDRKVGWGKSTYIIKTHKARARTALRSEMGEQGGASLDGLSLVGSEWKEGQSREAEEKRKQTKWMKAGRRKVPFHAGT